MQPEAPQHEKRRVLRLLTLRITHGHVDNKTITTFQVASFFKK